jgi:hypothetical protein
MTPARFAILALLPLTVVLSILVCVLLLETYG